MSLRLFVKIHQTSGVVFGVFRDERSFIVQEAGRARNDTRTSANLVSASAYNTLPSLLLKSLSSILSSFLLFAMVLEQSKSRASSTPWCFDEVLYGTRRRA
eukprot:TRINITY_DN13889_c0_g1_i1.p2 TRINITY_DN13889_c0_g1~~TRINITY_DN13889_c0_g1_i1.p2  ORF type:complete len:101 (-),score=11.73 TRINITY_DN13889_c0_g1_i1:431-733(-)